METYENMPRPEIIVVADAVARDKNIDKEDVFVAMEVAIQKAGRTKYGKEHDVRASIDRKTGAISLARYREVVADDAVIENEAAQIPLKLAKTYDKKYKVGDFIVDALPPIDFGRIAAQTARQVIMQKVREAERNKQYEEYKDKIGTIINGTVKKVEQNSFGNISSIVLEIGNKNDEAVLRYNEIIPREKFKNGDRVRAYVLDVRSEVKGPQIFLSRTCPEIWLNCLLRKFRKFMTVWYRLWVWLVIRGLKPRLLLRPMIKQLIRSVHVWVCAVFAFKQWYRSFRARK